MKRHTDSLFRMVLTLIVTVLSGTLYADEAKTWPDPFYKDGFFYASYYYDRSCVQLINPMSNSWNSYFPLVHENPAYEGDVVVPASIEKDGKTYKVVLIAPDTFYNCPDLRSITIPEGITSMAGAIQYCPRLRAINVDGTGGYYFSIDGVLFSQPQYWGKVLELFPEGKDIDYCVPEGTNVIWDGAFAGNTSINTITFPESLRRIGDRAFADCTSLQKADLPSSLEYIGEAAFLNAPLTQATLPPALHTLLTGAFAGTQVTSLHLPASLVNIYIQGELSYNPFEYMYSLKTLTVAPDNPAVFAQDNILYSKDGKVCVAMAPGACDDINNAIVIPEGVERINNDAFHDLPKLKDITFPSTLKKIGSYAFAGCGLTDLYIPDGVTEMGMIAFAANYNLKTIRLPETLTYLPESAFNWCSSLQKAVIPESVKSLGFSCFADCHEMTEIKLPKQMDQILDYALAYCWNLKEIRLPQGITEMTRHVLYGTGVSSPDFKIYIPGTVTDIRSGALAGTTPSHIYVETPYPPVCKNNICDYDSFYETVVHVPAESKATYENADTWGNFVHIEEDASSVETVGAAAGGIRITGSVLSLDCPAHWTLLTPDGRVCAMVENANRLDVSGHPHGIYIIRAVTSDGKTYTLKTRL